MCMCVIYIYIYIYIHTAYTIHVGRLRPLAGAGVLQQQVECPPAGRLGIRA